MRKFTLASKSLRILGGGCLHCYRRRSGALWVMIKRLVKYLDRSL